MEQTSLERFLKIAETYYPEISDDYIRTRRNLDLQDYNGSLNAARRTLERIARVLCGLNGISTGYRFNALTLEEITKNLFAKHILDNDLKEDFDSIRRNGNCGSHGDGTLLMARETLDLLEGVMGRTADFLDPQGAADGSQRILLPLYYSPKRKHRGDLAFVFSHEKLCQNQIYLELYEKTINGDISAMLDLAISFLPKRPTWGSEQLVCVPRQTDAGRTLEYDKTCTPDFRYYHWIIQACNRACEENADISPSHRRYLATALFEALKFCTHHYLGMTNGTGAPVSATGAPIHNKIFAPAQTAFGPVSISSLLLWYNKLIELVMEADSFDIIDPLHQNNRSLEGISHLLLCIAYGWGGNWTFHIYRNDGSCMLHEGPVTWEVLTQNLPSGGEYSFYYQTLVNHYNAAAQKAEQERIAAEQRKIWERENVEKKKQEEAQQKKTARKRLVLTTAAVLVFSLVKLIQWLSLDTIDPFASVQVKFRGAAPYGYVEVVNNSSLDVLDMLEYTVADGTGLENGDTVKVKIPLRGVHRRILRRYGYKILDKSETFKVSGLPEAVTKEKQIRNALDKETIKKIAGKLDSRIRDGSPVDIYNVLTGENEWSLWGVTCSLGNYDNVKNYFLLNNGKSAEEAFNYLVVIYELPATITTKDEEDPEVLADGTVHYAVVFRDITLDEEGDVTLNFSDAEYSGPFETVDDVLYTYVHPLKHAYKTTTVH